MPGGKKITPELFWEKFSKTLSDRLSADTSWREVYEKNGSWTKYMMQKEEPKGVLWNVGEELGFQLNIPDENRTQPMRGISREWNRIDVCYFHARGPIQGVDENWDLEVAVEHENQNTLKKFIATLVKLAHIACDLRVIITYHNYSKRADFALEDKLKIAKTFYDQLRCNAVNGKWLLIFGPTNKCLSSNDFVAYTLRDSEFEPLKRSATGIIPQLV